MTFTHRATCSSPATGETLLSDDGTLHYLTGNDTAEPLTEEAILARSVIRPAAYGADAQKNSEAEVHVLYCEDETLAQVAADLNNPRVRASTSGFRYYPVHEDPEGRAHYATALATPRLPSSTWSYSAYSGEEAPARLQGNARCGAPPPASWCSRASNPPLWRSCLSRDGERGAAGE